VSSPHRDNSPSSGALLLYGPDTALGWILHTVFYVVAIIFATWSLLALVGDAAGGGYDAVDLAVWAIFATPLVIVPLIIRRLARR
jgi:hypothetical protein